MSTWDDVKSTIKKVADSAVKKTGELTESTSIKLKISSKDSERERLFTSLGKLFYRKMKTTDNETSDKLTRKIHEAMAQIDLLGAEIRALKKQLEAVKEKNGDEMSQQRPDKQDFSVSAEKDELVINNDQDE